MNLGKGNRFWQGDPASVLFSKHKTKRIALCGYFFRRFGREAELFPVRFSVVVPNKRNTNFGVFLFPSRKNRIFWGTPKNYKVIFRGKEKSCVNQSAVFAIAKQANLSTHFDALRGGTIKNTNPLWVGIFYCSKRIDKGNITRRM
ncbi:MAG: hypothetical protein IJS74_03205 [Clostridia bacterium]|nr:hypothetical protein [Clostridia bacterium]